jgi:hypothetical protein
MYQGIRLPGLSVVDPWALLVCAPSVPHVEWASGVFTEGGGRIVGGLVAIGGNAAGDESTVTGDCPAVDAGLVGVNADRVGPCRPTQKRCSPLRLASYSESSFQLSPW